MTADATAQIVAFPETKVSVLDAYLRGLPSAPTRSVYRRVILQFTAFLGERPVLEATRRDVEAFRSHLESAGRAPQTIARALSALSGYFGFAMDEGLLEKNPAARARRPRIPDCSPRRALSRADTMAILAMPDLSTLVGLRDRALLVTLALQGLRISEALGLRVEDLDEEQGHKVARVLGKGAKVARVPLAAATWQAIMTWTKSAGLGAAGPIFVPVLKGGHIVPNKPMSPQSAWKRIGLLARQAGITRRVHPHLFRHAAVTSALAANVPLHSVQDFARHADPRTTRRYDSHRQSLSNPTAHTLAATLLAGDE